MDYVESQDLCGKKAANPPALKSLPPTDEALELNFKRVHYASIMWKNCDPGNAPPPKLNLFP